MHAQDELSPFQAKVEPPPLRKNESDPAKPTSVIFKAAVALILVVLIGMSLLGVLSYSVYDAKTELIGRSFNFEVDRKAMEFEREVRLNLEIMFALRSGLALLPEVNRGVFHELTADVLRRAPAIHGFAYAPWLEDKDRADFERVMQTEFSAFELTQVSGNGGTDTASERSRYVPVQYIEPLKLNRAALGFDLASEPNRLAALRAARLSGEMVATAGLTLVQETENKRGILVFTPLYHGNPTTPQERRAAHYAFINGVYRIETLYKQSIGAVASGNFLVRIIDVTDGIEDVLFASGNPRDERWRSDMARVEILPDVAGRQWAVEVTPTEEYISSQRGYLPTLIMVSGSLLLVLMASYVLFTVQRNNELRKTKQELEQVSLTDGLTGLANRRHFDQYLEQEWTRAQRDGLPLSLILIDIDYFKPFNDEYGHPAGDECLKRVSDVLRTVSRRPGDLVARYGGEEFALILPQTDTAQTVAEACRLAVEALSIPHAASGTAPVVTVSAGVCTLVPQPGMSPGLLTQSTDVALYEAKAKGRNRTHMMKVASVDIEKTRTQGDNPT
ncbi:MAG: hypothetical protein CL583_01085 [Alteromonadaceae bacterium]|nr:hypothetical protein [Alteromonadaceae bacterium]